MKRIFCLTALLIFVLSMALTVAAQDVSKLKYPQLNPINVPEVEKVTLDNGIRLYLLQDNTLPLVRASVRINCGSYLEPAEKIGLAAVTGTVMRTGGTEKYAGDQIDKMLESVGASVETGIGALSGSASMYTLQEHLDLGLEVLAELLRRPVFAEEKIELAKVQIRSGISRRNDDPFSVAIREFNKAIYGKESVYARHSEYATIDAISREDLVAFHRAWFHPENVQIAVWGAIDKPQMIEKIKQYFGDWAKGNVQVPPPPEVKYTYEPKIYFAEKSDVNQTNILVGHIGGLITDPDYPALTVMNNILGGSFASRLFNNVRSKEGLAYAVSGAYTANINYPGIFYTFTSTKSETTAKAIQEVIKQVKSMQTDPPTPSEMTAAKDGYVNSFVFNFDSRGQVISRLMNYDFYGLPEDFLFKEKELIEKVTPEDVINAAKKNLHTDALCIVVVGKGADFEKPLDQLGLGPVETLDITIPKAEPKRELSITPETLQKGKELLAKSVKVHGGLPAFKKVKSMSMVGKNTIVTPQGEFPIGFEMVYAFPDKVRQIASFMGQKMADVRNGKTGWKMAGPGQLAEKTPEDIAKDDQELSRNTVWLFGQSDKADLQVVYDGSGSVNGTAAEYVAVLDQSGKPAVRLALDAANSMLLAKEFWGETFAGEGNVQETYSDFQTVNGLLVPMTAVWTMNGQKVQTISFETLQVNSPVSPDAFEKPQL